MLPVPVSSFNVVSQNTCRTSNQPFIVLEQLQEHLEQYWCAGILSQNDYLNLVQCETLEDLKLHLQSTDYGNFLANESTLQVNFVRSGLAWDVL